jgi:hypothetical protein
LKAALFGGSETATINRKEAQKLEAEKKEILGAAVWT